MEQVKNKFYNVFGKSLATEILLKDVSAYDNDNMNIVKFRDKIIYSYDLQLCIEYLLYLLLKDINDYPKPTGKYLVAEGVPVYFDPECGCNSDCSICYDVVDKGCDVSIHGIGNYIYDCVRDGYPDIDKDDEDKNVKLLDFWLITSNDIAEYAKYIFNNKLMSTM